MDVVVIGAGEVYQKKIKPVLKDLGIEKFKIFDPDYSDIKSDEVNLKTFEEITSDDIAFVLSPNKFHLSQLLDLVKKQVPVYVEKPFVLNQNELEIFNSVQINSPVYLGDYYVFKALGLLCLLGVDMPYKEFLKIEKDDSGKLQKVFDNNESILSIIEKIEGNLLEGGKLGSIEHRSWLSEPEQGGMLLDLMLHLLNIIHLAGFEVSGINDVELLQSAENIGEYESLTPQRAEDKAQVKGVMNSEISFNLNTGKNALANDRWLKFTDKNGYSLKLIFNDKNEVLYSHNEDILGLISLQIDPYYLTMKEALSFLNDKNNRLKYYDIQKKSIICINRIKNFN